MVDRLKITVLKREVCPDLIRRYQAELDDERAYAPCGRFHDGETFLVEPCEKPDGFCSWAWADIQRQAIWVALRGVQPGYKHPGTAVACCTDGLRPVFFRLELVDVPEEASGEAEEESA